MDRVKSLEKERTGLEQAILQCDEQLMQIRGLPATYPQGLPLHFSAVDMLMMASSMSLGHMPSIWLPGQSVLTCAENFDGVAEGLQPDKAGPLGPPIRIVLSLATPNIQLKIPTAKQPLCTC